MTNLQPRVYRAIVYIVRWLIAEMYKIGVQTLKSVFLLSEVPSKHNVIYAHVEIEKCLLEKIALDLLYATEKTPNSSIRLALLLQKLQTGTVT